MAVSAELRLAFDAATEDLLSRLQKVVDAAVLETRSRLEEEHQAAVKRLDHDRVQVEKESQLMWAQLSADRVKLAERESELAIQLATFSKEKETMASGGPDDVLELSLGGERDVSVLRSTLCAIDGSMLATRFSGRWDDQCPKDSRGRFFVDCPADVFDPLLSYLREKKIAGPNTTSWPPPVPEHHAALFHKMSDYFGVAPPPAFIWSPSRFEGTNNGCPIDGTAEAIRITVDSPILLRGVQVLGPRLEDSAHYVGWVAIHQGERQLVRHDVDYTVHKEPGAENKVMLSQSIPLEVGKEYDIVLCVQGPDSTCGEAHAVVSSVTAENATITFGSSPLDEAGTGLREGVIPGIIFMHAQS